MREIDERLLDQILDTIRTLGTNVADLYEKHGVNSKDVVRLKEQIKSHESRIDELKKAHEKLQDSDTDNRVYRGVSAFKWSIIGLIGAALVTGIITAVVSLMVGHIEGGTDEVQQSESQGE